MVSSALVVCLRGDSGAPVSQEQSAFDSEALVPTDEARVVSKRAAQELADEGLFPPSQDLLIVRLTPEASEETVDLSLEFQTRDIEDRSFSVPEAAFDSVILFVAGPEAELPSFPGVTVLDVSEDSERGFAPSVEVVALDQPPIELSTAETEARTAVHRASAAPFAEGSGLAVPRAGIAHPLQTLVAAAVFLDAHSEVRLVLIGHASPGEANGLALSTARADGVAQLIRGERDAWVQTATDFGSLADVKGWLSYLTRERGWSCDPGSVTSENDAQAKAGVESFQREYNERFEASIGEDGICGKDTLGALFDVIESELDSALGERSVDRQALRLADPAALGAGESLHAHANLPQPGGAENRRIVDALLLPPEVPSIDSAAAVYDGGYAFLSA